MPKKNEADEFESVFIDKHLVLGKLILIKFKKDTANVEQRFLNESPKKNKENAFKVSFVEKFGYFASKKKIIFLKSKLIQFNPKVFEVIKPKLKILIYFKEFLICNFMFKRTFSIFKFVAIKKQLLQSKFTVLILSKNQKT